MEEDDTRKKKTKTKMNNESVGDGLDGVIYEFVKNQLECLEVELEDGRQLEEKVLKELNIQEVSIGLYGRTVLSLGSSTVDGLLKSHSFTVGDDVQIQMTTRRQEEEEGEDVSRVLDGVIQSLNDVCMSITLYNKSVDWLYSTKGDNVEYKYKIQVVSKSMIEIHRKVTNCLKQMQSSWDTLPSHPIVRYAFAPHYSNTSSSSSSSWWKDTEECPSHLNEVQWKAIQEMACEERIISLLHGPPGTGKTTTIAEYILQYCFHHPTHKVLVTAPSNVAVDNILQKVASTLHQHHHTTSSSSDNRRKKNENNKKKNKRIQMVRLGHPARMNSSILKYSLEQAIAGNDGTAIVQDVKKELQQLWSSSSKKYPKNKSQTASLLKKEIQTREQKIVQQTLQESQIVYCTNMGAANKILSSNNNNNNNNNSMHFDLIVMDEAAQATEASSWIPLFLRGTKKVILAGDHCQLPPTVLSQQPHVLQNLSMSLFQRLITKHTGATSISTSTSTTSSNNHTNYYSHPNNSHLLTIQYRMHPSICQWSSQAMYHNQLISHPSMSQHTLRSYPTTTTTATTTMDDDDDMLDVPMLVIDTSDCDMYEQVESTNNSKSKSKSKGSRCNPGEAMLVQQHVEYLIQKCGIHASDIAIISPYNAQVQLLKQLLLPSKLEIKSVDGFQGGERDVVILSLVRSSPKGGSAGIGFLAEQRRLNVAITRAKRHVAVICDVTTISQNTFLQQLIHYIEEHGQVRSAMEYDTTTTTTTSSIHNRPTEWMQDILTSVSNNDTTDTVNDTNSTIVRDKVKKKESPTNNKNNKNDKNDFISTNKDAITNKNRHNNNNNNNHHPSKEREEEQKRRKQQEQQFKDKLEFFQLTCQEGESMDMGPSLSSYERRIVHEIADSMKLQHTSIGTDDNRRIIITQPSKTTTTTTTKTTTTQAVPPSLEHGNDVDDSESMKEDTHNHKLHSYTVLDDSNVPDTSTMLSTTNTTNASVTANGEEETMNSMLKQLALERQSRSQSTKSQPQPAVKPSKKKKKQGQKLGGAKKQVKKKKKEDEVEEQHDMIEDDMAFLDAQIEKVQTSHGRKIEATGSNYKTIVNGILISKPKVDTKPKKDTRAASALNSKIRQAQEGRKSKKKKK